MISQRRRDVCNKKPLIHCITNPISITQCANAILAVGGRPIMAEHPDEVAEITETADALMLNLGNITDVRMESMKIAFQKAIDCNIPIVLDAVGVACSKLRREYIDMLLHIGNPSIIKGNYSEILALYNLNYHSAGVDAEHILRIEQVEDAAIALANQYHTIVLASGKTDLVTDGKKVAYIENGSEQLATITGTGCMLGALCTCYCGVEADFTAAITSCVVLGISGELSRTEKGSGTFFVNLMDHVNTLEEKQIEDYLRMEVKQIERS